MGRADRYERRKPYQAPTALTLRRSAVISQLRHALDRCPPGPVKLISLCASQGRDLFAVLADHPRRRDVTARLVELDPKMARTAQQLAGKHSDAEVIVVRADAGVTNAYVGAVPAQIVVICGVFGYLTREDVERTIETLPSLCAPHASVIWTRHRRPPDVTPAIRSQFESVGFAERAFEAPEGLFFAVGAHEFVGDPRPIEPGRRIFTLSRQELPPTAAPASA